MRSEIIKWQWNKKLSYFYITLTPVGSFYHTQKALLPLLFLDVQVMEKGLSFVIIG